MSWEIEARKNLYSKELQCLKSVQLISLQHFLEESDQLWKLHCEKEFKGSEPDEFESYRELYLVIHKPINVLHTLYM